MINLLPPKLKTERKYARQNRKLMLWLGLCILGVLGLSGVTAGGFFFLDRAAQSQEASNRQLAQVLEETKVDEQISEFKDFASKLQTVTNVLDKQYLFSNLVRRLGGTIPPGAVLASISLTGEDRALDLSFSTVDNATANLILVNLNDKNNGLFKQADTTTISCVNVSTEPNAPVVEFPCTTSVKVLFHDDTDFVLLNALLSEQALSDALRGLRSEPGFEKISFGYVKIDGVKDTVMVQMLHNSPSDPDRIINLLLNSSSGPKHSYSFKNASGKTETMQTPYFREINVLNQICSSEFTDSTEDSDTYSCQSELRLVMALDESEIEQKAEEKEQDGTDSLEEAFIERFGGER